MIPKTIAGALRKLLVDADLVGERVYLDFAPVDTEKIPYMTYNENVGTTPLMRGDARTMFFGRDIQLNLWQKDNEEDPALAHQIMLTLDGAMLKVEGASMGIKVKVESCTRMADNLEDQLVHHEITVSVVKPREVI